MITLASLKIEPGENIKPELRQLLSTVDNDVGTIFRLIQST